MDDTTPDDGVVVQLALFGDPERVPPPELIEPDNPALDQAVREVLEDLTEFDLQLDLLLDSYPAAERGEAARHLYLNAEGNPSTRHRLLRIA